MAGTSFSGSDLPALVANAGYEVASDAYSRAPALYPQFAEVVSPADLSHPWKGDKRTTAHGGAKPVERHPSQEPASSKLHDGYTPQGRFRHFSRQLEVADVDVKAALANPANLTRGPIGEFIESFTTQSVLERDKYVAKVLVQGCLTAGDKYYFDGSFDGNPDPNIGFIYDGLPLFDTAHPTKHGPSGTVYANHVASATLGSATLQTAIKAINTTNAVDEFGEPIIQFSELVMVPGALAFDIEVLLETAGKPGSANNDTNVLRGKVRPLVNPFLDALDADGWFVFASRRDLRVIDSGMPVFDTFYDQRRKTWVVNGEYLFGAYAKNWRGMHANNIAAS